jgi:hypothetical protein
MGIRVKNLHNFVCVLKRSMTLTATTNADVAKVHFNGWFSTVVAKLSDGGTGATASIADIHLNGTTIFGAATKMTFVATTGVASYSTLSSTPQAVTAGDLLTLDIDSISTAPINLVCHVTISRTPVDQASNAEDQDTIM